MELGLNLLNHPSKSERFEQILADNQPDPNLVLNFIVRTEQNPLPKSTVLFHP